MNKLSLIWIIVFLLALPFINAATFTEYTLGNYNFTVAAGQGICKIVDNQSYFYIGTAAEVKRYLPNGTFDADVGITGDVGGRAVACNSTFIFVGEGTSGLLETFDHAGNDQSLTIDIEGTTGNVNPDLCLTPNGTFIYAFSRSPGTNPGKVWRFRHDTRFPDRRRCRCGDAGR